MTIYNDLIAVVCEKPSELERWLVFADKLMEDGNAHGEAVASDIYLRRGMISGEQAQEAREFLRNKRKEVWQWYAGEGEQIPSSYFLENNDLWVGAFPLRFPNKSKMNQKDSVFVGEEFPRSEIMPRADTYARGVHQLRQHCKQETSITHITHPIFEIDSKKVYRPFTFKENILARVEDYWTLYNSDGNKRDIDNRLRLFNTWLDSCTGIAYKVNSPEFKIILQSPHLIGINEDFNDEFLPIDYASLLGDGVITLNRNNGTYNQVLTQEQVPEQPAWNAAVEEDKPLLQEHTDIIFSQRKRNNMGFWLRTGVAEDQLRALFVYNLDNDSYAYGSSYLNDNGRCLAK
ncbi:MAG: hypothetical protein Q8R37_05580 [Nanoarchaeota archaeon]|nr:hypothetical protein [Nanoarchaeota archaeon]